MIFNYYIDIGNLGSVLNICKKDLVKSLYELFKGGLIYIVVWYEFLKSYYKFCYKKLCLWLNNCNKMFNDFYYIWFIFWLFIIIVLFLFYNLDISIDRYL